MTYRKFDTGAWQDPWFEGLKPEAKLLFIYLFTCDVCNQSGLYEISKKRMEFEVGIRIDEIMPDLAGKIFWDKDRQIVWVKSFFRWQCQNESFALGAFKQIENSPYFNEYTLHNLDLIQEYRVLCDRYHINTMLTPCQDSADTVSTHCQDSEHTNPTSEQNRKEQSRTETEQTKNICEVKTSPDDDFSETQLVEQKKNNNSAKIKEIFLYWKNTLDHPKARMDEKRKLKIRSALKNGYSVDDIKLAIDGCLASPYHQGENERSSSYDSLELICRDSEHIDRFIKLSKEKDARLLSAKGRQARQNGQTWLQMRKQKTEAQHG